jgi:hypothetical protein
MVFDFPSLAALVDYVHKQCSEAIAEPAKAAGETNDAADSHEADALRELSPAEAEEILAAELAKARELLS